MGSMDGYVFTTVIRILQQNKQGVFPSIYNVLSCSEYVCFHQDIVLIFYTTVVNSIMDRAGDRVVMCFFQWLIHGAGFVRLQFPKYCMR